jgi:tetratricopeptide (TPR) repeat protein
MISTKYTLNALAIGMALIFCFFSSTTHVFADLVNDVRLCSGDNPDIAACTRAIHSGQLPLASLELAHYVRGYGYLHAGQHESAIRDFTMAITLKPEDLAPRIFRGQAYGVIQKFDEAINDCDFAIKADPKHPMIPLCLNARGIAHYYKGNYKAAIEDLDILIGQFAGASGAYLFRGSAKEELGDKSGAVADYRLELKLGGLESMKKIAWDRLKALGEM